MESVVLLEWWAEYIYVQGRVTRLSNYKEGPIVSIIYILSIHPLKMEGLESLQSCYKQCWIGSAVMAS